MPSLLRQTIGGLAKTASFTAAKSVVDAATFLALVWILQIADPWGNLLFALAFLELAHQLSSFGGGRYLTQRRDLSDAAVATVTTAELSASSLWAIAWWFGSPALLAVCGWGHLGEVARWFAPWLVTERLGQPARALLEREMRFGRSNAALFAGTLTLSSVSLLLAALGFGVWAFVLGRVAQSAVTTVAMWLAARRLPTLGWSRAEARPYFDFGVRLFLADLLLLYYRNVPQLVIGVVLRSPAIVGIYGVAARLPDYLRQIQDLTATVFYPAFTRARDAGQLRQGFELAVKYSAAVALLPLCLVLILGPGVAGNLLPADYAGGIAVLQVFTALAVLRIITNHWYFAYISRGETRGLPQIAAINAVGVTAGALIGIQWGITGVAAGVAVPSTFTILLALRVLLPRVVQVSYLPPLRIPLAAAIATLAAGLALLTAGLDQSRAPVFWLLALGLSVVYVTVGLALDAPALRQLAARLRA